ncbi:MAG TPA: LLM class flavin-dependent oxidoreductase [Xanthobacteraceae bacterium]|jgi:alkanesulfonate monooxygenase SsuD/methylene tetrahydromethanopterin reductase-like flavin-dependent oxidoreductase (luciferase family)|nr:LLM class flavin-dependent oxidoreductase [Xanthobacteraceae bacterium]
MEFGIFDHLDRNTLDLQTYYRERLKLIRLYDEAGFYAYHLAEHHGTPLGMAPSPGIFLSAVAQNTKRLRFGPMVYQLPLYHPIRLIEEICMLDQLSGGRLEIGFGRGASPIELEVYGEDPAQAQAAYTEGLELILKGLTEKSLSYAGDIHRFDNVPMELEPLQKPHPPVWYGVHSPEGAETAARRKLCAISLDDARTTRISTDRYREVWQAAHGSVPLPKFGIGRFIVVADTDASALALARRAYPMWSRSFTHFERTHGWAARHPRPRDFDTLAEIGQGIAGSPATVRAFLEDQLKTSGTNYVVGQFAFGDLTPHECETSVRLFADNVMPTLRKTFTDV